MRVTRRTLREIRDMVDLAHRMTREAVHGDADHEVVVMTSALHATLALEVVPFLLDEIERLLQQRSSRVTVIPKMDRTGGVA